MSAEVALYKSILSCVLCLAGLIVNLFIVSSIVLQMRLQGSLQTASVLIACDSLNNLALICLTCTIIIALTLKICPNVRMIKYLLFSWQMFTVMQMWGISVICVFYCLKIVPWRGSFFLWLKRNFTIVAAILLMVGFAFGLTLSFIDLYREHTTPLNNATVKNVSSQICPDTVLYDSLTTAKMIISALLHTCVFSLMSVSCAALVVHLYSHVKKMRGNQPDVGGGAKQQGVTSVAVMIFLLALEFGCCTNARLCFIIMAKDVITVPLITNICLVSLTLCSLIPITLIAGISSLRGSAASCCFKA